MSITYTGVPAGLNPEPLFPARYGIKNVRGGKKVVCWVTTRSVASAVENAHFYGGLNGSTESLNSAIAAGAHEIYTHATALAGVGDLLPAGAVLEKWNLNGHYSGGVARADLGGQVAPPAIHAG